MFLISMYQCTQQYGCWSQEPKILKLWDLPISKTAPSHPDNILAVCHGSMFYIEHLFHNEFKYIRRVIHFYLSIRDMKLKACFSHKTFIILLTGVTSITEGLNLLKMTLPPEDVIIATAWPLINVTTHTNQAASRFFTSERKTTSTLNCLIINHSAHCKRFSKPSSGIWVVQDTCQEQ